MKTMAWARLLETRVACVCSLLVLPALASPGRAATPSGTYQGWLWELGTTVESPFAEDEVCPGLFDLTFAPGLTWSAASTEFCYGRRTGPAGRSLINIGPTLTEDGASTSTQPLVSAGGNLYEVYGENDDEPGEERMGTLQSEPSAASLLIVGSHEFADSPALRQQAQAVHVAVKRTPAVVAARTAEDLEGTSWRIAHSGRATGFQAPYVEFATSTHWSLSLGAAGACTFAVSAVEPQFQKSADSRVALGAVINATQEFRNFVAQGGIAGGEFSNCAYTIDENGYLALTMSRTPDGGGAAAPASRHFEISDDGRYLVTAPEANLTTTPAQLTVGFRTASGLTPAALDGDYLVYSTFSEYLSTGTANPAATGLQEHDTLSRGLLSFDSSTPSAPPDGLGGNWFACHLQSATNALRVGFTGTFGAANVTPGTLMNGERFHFSTCKYRLDADGALKLQIARVTNGVTTFGTVLNGYVNDSGEVLTLAALLEVPAGPREIASNGYSSMLQTLAMRYTGVPNGNADGDALTNFEELQSPLPVAASPRCAEGELPIVCALPDITGDGIPDVAALRAPSSVEIRSGADNALVRTLAFLGAGYTTVGALAMPDTDADGTPEFAVLAVRASDSRIVVQIRDIDGSGTPRQVFFATGNTPLAIALVGDDADNDGVPELAVLSTRNSDARGMIELKNAAGVANAKSLLAPLGYTPHDLEVVPDADGNGVPDLALLATRNSDGRILGQVRNADGLGALYSTFFALNQTAIDLAVVPDKDDDGIPELAVLSSRISDGRLLVELKNASGAANQFPFWLSTGYTGIALEAVAPADGNATPEVAVLSQRQSDGRILVTVRDAIGADTPRSNFYTTGYVARGLAIFKDVDRNAVDEAAVLMIRNSDGRIYIQSRNTIGDANPKTWLFAP
jgi:hypothetical protein